MKFDPDDPRLSEYALGEMDDALRPQFAAQLAADPQAQAMVEEIRAMAASLTQDLSRESSDGLGPARRQALFAQLCQPPKPPLPRTPVYHVLTHPIPERYAAWRGLAVAGVAASIIIALGGAAMIWSMQHRTQMAQQPATSPRKSGPIIFPASPAPGASIEDFAGTSAGAAGDTAFVDVRTQSVSRFPLSVSTASYQSLRRDIAAGHLPDAKSVRIEDLINAFVYHYSPPSNADVFSVSLEAAACPWDASHRLVRIGIKARDASPGAAPSPVARNATAQVEFDPAQASAYRLLGYTRAAGPTTATGPAGGCDVMPGQQITVLYEVILAPPAASAASAPSTLLKLVLDYRRPDASAPIQQVATLLDQNKTLPQATPDFQFAAAVADFGLALQQDVRRNPERFDRVLQFSANSRGSDADGSRAQFIELVKRVRELSKA